MVTDILVVLVLVESKVLSYVKQSDVSVPSRVSVVVLPQVLVFAVFCATFLGLVIAE